MKCYVCMLEADRDAFGRLDVYARDGGALVARMGTMHLGSVTVLACPNCGALHSTLQGKIQANDRKE